MSAYCETSDLYAYGLPRGALPNPGRLAAGVSVDLDAILLGGHAFAAGDPLTLRAEAGGSLPAPLVEGVRYYALPLHDDALQVAASVGGTAINLTTTGARVLLIGALPIAESIRWASAIIEDMLPAHVVPLVAPYPDLIVATAAELAAGKLLTRTGSASRSLSEMIDAAQKRLAKWGKGIPLRGENTPPPANLSASASASSATVRDPRGWLRYGGL